MTHRLSTNYAKNYCNRTLIVKVIVENVVTCFWGGHGVYNNWRVSGCRRKHSALRSFLATTRLSCLTSNAIFFTWTFTWPWRHYLTGHAHKERVSE